MAVDDDSTRKLTIPVVKSVAAVNASSDASEPDELATGGAILEAPPAPSRSSVVRAAVSLPVRLALVVGLVTVLALAGLTGWLGVRAYHSHQDDAQRSLFLQVGRQGALNLTTIDYQHADADIQRILDSATGNFYDDFSKRARPFIDVVKQVKSKSVGTVTEAGVESLDGNDAQILVAIAVNTSNAGAPEQQPRAWRMRISVTKVGAQAKVSNVAFVP